MAVRGADGDRVAFVFGGGEVVARIRTIKPEFWTHEDLSALPEATHMLAAALLNYADDHGYFNANPALIRAACCPLREPSVSIPESLRSLQAVGYIALGRCSKGRMYGQIVNFREHQKVSHPTPSKIEPISITWDDSGIFPEPLRNPPETFRPEQGTGNREQGTGNREENGAAAPSLDDFDRSISFAELWSRWPTGFGEKGSRKSAEAAYLKIKPDKPLHETMMAALDAQVLDKSTKAMNGQFAPNFPHVERWLKNQRWTDEISRPVASQRQTRAQQSDDAFERYRQQLADSAGDSASDAGFVSDAAALVSAGHH